MMNGKLILEYDMFSSMQLPWVWCCFSHFGYFELKIFYGKSQQRFTHRLFLPIRPSFQPSGIRFLRIDGWLTYSSLPAPKLSCYICRAEAVLSDACLSTNAL